MSFRRDRDANGVAYMVDERKAAAFFYSCRFAQHIAQHSTPKEQRILVYTTAKEVVTDWNTVKDFAERHARWDMIDFRGHLAYDLDEAFRQLGDSFATRRSARRAIQGKFDSVARHNQETSDALSEAIEWAKFTRDTALTSLAIVGGVAGGAYVVGTAAASAAGETFATWQDTGDAGKTFRKGVTGLLTLGLAKFPLNKLSSRFSERAGVAFGIGMDGLLEVGNQVWDGKSYKQACAQGLAKCLIGAGVAKADGSLDKGMESLKRQILDNKEMVEIIDRSGRALKPALQGASKVVEKQASGTIEKIGSTKPRTANTTKAAAWQRGPEADQWIKRNLLHRAG